MHAAEFGHGLTQWNEGVAESVDGLRLVAGNMTGEAATYLVADRGDDSGQGVNWSEGGAHAWN
ncbi:hypothetical protein ACGFRB_23310 [Streptomyces sp. NPDC048718]|uniref:hypothetical protein n=1 Tax=Streptomyces sp. NPDC048718 TaxID=3365587 RepID=UPI003713AA58